MTRASSGIGRASAEALARAGFTVFGTSRRPGGNAPKGQTLKAIERRFFAELGYWVKANKPT